MGYPEHEKLEGLDGSNQIVGDFIGWLGEQGYEICRWNEGRTYCLPANVGRDQLIADHFEIDRDKLEQEKRQMLAALKAA